MIQDLNQFILIGRIGKIRIIDTKNGDKVAFVSIACNLSHGTEWNQVSVFGKKAEYLSKYCKIGDKVLLQGKLNTRKDKRGIILEAIIPSTEGNVQLLTSEQKVGEKNLEVLADELVSQRKLISKDSLSYIEQAVSKIKRRFFKE